MAKGTMHYSAGAERQRKYTIYFIFTPHLTPKSLYTRNFIHY